MRVPTARVQVVQLSNMLYIAQISMVYSSQFRLAFGNDHPWKKGYFCAKYTYMLHLVISPSKQNRFWIQYKNTAFWLSFHVGVKLICQSWQLKQHCYDGGFAAQVYYTESMCN